jgi:hypothetical protein
MSNAHSLNCLIIWILFHIVTYPNNSGLAPDWNETIEKYWVINRSEYYRQQVFQAVENDKAQFASDNDTAMIQYIE